MLATMLVFLATSPLFSVSSRVGFESVKIGAYDPEAWNGIVFIAKAYGQPANFALRVGSKVKNFLDGGKIFNAVARVGPHAPDGSYCRISWQNKPREALVTLEWSRLNSTTVVGRLTAAKDFELVLETYFPYRSVLWGTQGFYSIGEGQRAIFGDRYFDKVYSHTARFVVMLDRPTIGSGIYPSLAELRDTMNGSSKLISSALRGTTAGAAGLEFTTGESGRAHFVVKIGRDKRTLIRDARDLLSSGRIDTILKDKAATYARHRPQIRGLFAGSAEAIGNSMFWNTLYAPSNGLTFPSISRHWARHWGGWVVGEWDCFFGALLTSLESKPQTAAAIKAILGAQTDTGLVPNAASGAGITPDRSQPPVGSYLSWKVSQAIHDRALLEWAYPRLRKWHEWWFADRGDGQPWRDGNRDGLLEYGSDRGSTSSRGGRGYLQAAKFESGMDDSPMYDHASYDASTYTMNLDDVGLNSLYTLDAECLAKIARILGMRQDSEHFTEEAEHMKRLVRERLWNPKDGIYENRFWNGQFSKHLSPTNFYPLLAGIATHAQAKRMVEEHLKNPKEFWGKYVIPTIARDDPAFKDQYYWRGDIWGPTNYLVYEGLERYGFDAVALQFAEKSYELFMSDWKTNQFDDEQYHAWGGNGGGDPHYTWGALLCLIAAEQYIDDTPWGGLRFGALNPPVVGESRGIPWDGHTFRVTVGAERTILTRDGKVRFEATGGVVVRNYEPEISRLTFMVKADKSVQITTAEFDTGELTLKIDGKVVGKVILQDGVGSFSVPAGQHDVELVK
jgi:hypothetical protein